MNSKAAARLVSGVLMIGVFAGMTMGCGTADKAAGPGPTKVVAGVPVGYERSRAGAIRAALGYEEALVSLGSTPASWQDSIEAMAVPSRRKRIVEAMTPGLELISKNLGREGFVRGAVLAFRVKA